jgi:hypothetical protein
MVTPEGMFYILLIFSVPLCNNPMCGSTRLIISPSKSYYKAQNTVRLPDVGANKIHW